jgi:hypothetical protein
MEVMPELGFTLPTYMNASASIMSLNGTGTSKDISTWTPTNVRPFFAGQYAVFNGTQPNCRYLHIGPTNITIRETGFTVTAVLRFTNNASAWERLLELGSGVRTYPLLLTRNGNSKRLSFGYEVDGTSAQLMTPTMMFEQNVVYQIAFTYDPQLGDNGVFSFWVNGILRESIRAVVPPQIVYATTPYIGRSVVAANGCLNADVFSLKLYNYVSSAGQIMADTMADFGQDVVPAIGYTVPYAVLPIALNSTTGTSVFDAWTFNNVRPDFDGAAYTFVGTALSGSASCPYLNAGPQNLTLASTGFTALLIVEFTDDVGVNEKLVDLGNGPDGYGISIGRVVSTKRLGLHLTTSSSTIVLAQSNIDFGSNQTHRVAIVYDPSVGSTGEVIFYWNNTRQNSIVSPVKLQDTVASYTLIGRSNAPSQPCFKGRMFSLQVHQRVLDTSEIMDQIRAPIVTQTLAVVSTSTSMTSSVVPVASIVTLYDESSSSTSSTMQAVLTSYTVTPEMTVPETLTTTSMSLSEGRSDVVWTLTPDETLESATTTTTTETSTNEPSTSSSATPKVTTGSMQHLGAAVRRQLASVLGFALASLGVITLTLATIFYVRVVIGPQLVRRPPAAFPSTILMQQY